MKWGHDFRGLILTWLCALQLEWRLSNSANRLYAGRRYQTKVVSDGVRDYSLKVKSKRKKILVNQDFQLSFVGYFSALALLGIVIIYGANLYFFWNLKQQGHAIGLDLNHVFFQFVADQQRLMNIVFCVTSVFVFFLMILGGLFLSHLVAGPMMRLKKTF